MKKTLFTLLLTTLTTHAADTPEAATQALIQHLFDGQSAQAVALTHISPELLAEGIDENLLKQQLQTCYDQVGKDMRESGFTLARVEVLENDGNAAQLKMVLQKAGDESEQPPMQAFKSAQSWQIDMLGELAYSCENIDFGDPLAVLARYIDAWQRDDGDAAFALIDIGEPYFTHLTPAEYHAKSREDFSQYYRAHPHRKLRILEQPIDRTQNKVRIQVMDDHTSREDTIILRKTSHGWRLDQW